MLKLIQAGNMDKNKLSRELFERREAIAQLYQKKLAELARKNGEEGAHPAFPRARLFPVIFKSKPPGAELKLISAGELELFRFFQRHRILGGGWKPREIPVTIGKPIQLYGYYILYAKWRNGQSAKDRITVTRSGTITVMPDET